MIGMYSSNGRQRLGNIEKGRCCRPKSQTSKTSPPHSTTGVGVNVRADSIFVDFGEMIATDLGA